MANLYTIYDGSKKKFLAPFVCNTNEEAERFIIQTLKQSPESLFCMFPRSFDLYHIGFYNDDSGLLKQDDITCLCNFEDLKERSINGD